MPFFVGAVDTRGKPHVVLSLGESTVLLSIEVARHLGQGLIEEAALAEALAADLTAQEAPELDKPGPGESS